jgi:hypothetical protein
VEKIRQFIEKTHQREPAINADLTHSVKAPEDLTLAQMRDVGWFPDADLEGLEDSFDQCPTSDRGPTVIINGCDSGVPNTLFTSGCTISDLIAGIASKAKNHGDFQSGVADLADALKRAGIIDNKQSSDLKNCSATTNMP